MEEALKSVLTWPEKPLCHGSDPMFAGGGGVYWRPPAPDGHPSNSMNPYGYPFRECNYCGSMHPEDLYNLLREGTVRLKGSDWKYGWPHKFYVEGVPNPLAGQRVVNGMESCSSRERLSDPNHPDVRVVTTLEITYHNGEEVSRRGGPTHYERPLYSEGSKFTHAKWYNEHLHDLNPQAFEVMALLLFRYSGINFQMLDGKLKYNAPVHGYQQA